MSHLQGVLFVHVFSVAMVEGHCVRPSKGEGERGETLGARMSLSMSKIIFRRPLNISKMKRAFNTK